MTPDTGPLAIPQSQRRVHFNNIYWLAVIKQTKNVCHQGINNNHIRANLEQETGNRAEVYTAQQPNTVESLQQNTAKQKK